MVGATVQRAASIRAQNETSVEMRSAVNLRDGSTSIEVNGGMEFYWSDESFVCVELKNVGRVGNRQGQTKRAGAQRPRLSTSQTGDLETIKLIADSGLRFLSCRSIPPPLVNATFVGRFVGSSSRRVLFSFSMRDSAASRLSKSKYLDRQIDGRKKTNIETDRIESLPSWS